MNKKQYDEQADDLRFRLELLARKQQSISNELKELQTDFENMNLGNIKTKPEHEAKSLIETKIEPSLVSKNKTPNQNSSRTKEKHKSFNWEKFIGENLSNKIGIIIIVIGVGIGFQYSIEHELIVPELRVVLAYLFGAGLLAVGLWLKQKYKKFSAVLVSGAMSISYFVTYAAYNYYNFFSVNIAFGIMLFITLLTVFFALHYKLQVIAHIGLVGAYVLPFLTSTGSENAVSLFIYMSIINIGVLILAFKKYWQALYYLAFVSTWIIFSFWSFNTDMVGKSFNIAIIFSSIFFVIFYSISLLYKLLNKQKYNIADVLIILANSFVYYGLIFRILDINPEYKDFLGLFTLCNALIHLIVSVSIYKLSLADRNLFYLVAGLVLVFVTATAPVQFDGNSVTVLWAYEALVLFWIGRTRQTRFYERLSYPLMLLAFVSIVQDWYALAVIEPLTFEPFFNNSFLSSFIVILAFATINYFNFKIKIDEPTFRIAWVDKTLVHFAPLFLTLILYYTFRLEISNYYQDLYTLSEIKVPIANGDIYETLHNYNLVRFKQVWLLNYSLLFMTLLSVLNIMNFKNHINTKLILIINSVLILNFLSVGLIQLAELREQFLSNESLFPIDSSFLYIRYISLVLLICLLIISKKISNSTDNRPTNKQISVIFELFFYFVLLVLSTAELIAWLEIARFADSYKLATSIIWALYALLLVSLGIWRHKKHLRWAAIVLFTVTLFKLFLYDLSHLATIPKTMVFVSIGLLLLGFSYLYNRFKTNIFDDNKIEE